MKHVKSIDEAGHDVYTIPGRGHVQTHPANPGFVSIAARLYTPLHTEIWGKGDEQYALNTHVGVAGVAMPLVRLARALGLITREQYKRIKDQIEASVRRGMWEGASMREVRGEIRRLERIAA